MTATIRAGAILTAALGLASCSSEPTPPSDSCSAPGVVFTPPEPTVAVGDTIRLSVTYKPGAAFCAPDTPAGQLRWTSSDPAVAAVDSVSGLVTGAQVGPAYLHVHAPGQPALGDSLLLRVYVPLFNRIVFTSRPPVPCAATEDCATEQPDGRHVPFDDVKAT